MDNTVAVAFEPTPLSAVLADYAGLFKLRVNLLVITDSLVFSLSCRANHSV